MHIVELGLARFVARKTRVAPNRDAAIGITKVGGPDTPEIKHHNSRAA
jgi:hypothetical protein